MKRKLVPICLLGACVGLAISTLIAIVISLALGDGQFHPVAPQLAEDCGSELLAVVLQTVFSFLYGAAWAGASLIWRQERWSLLRQTATHLLICSLATFPIAYGMRWMHHSVSGVCLYFGIFIGIYAVIWLAQYSAMKKRIAKLNETVQGQNGQR